MTDASSQGRKLRRVALHEKVIRGLLSPESKTPHTLPASAGLDDLLPRHANKYSHKAVPPLSFRSALTICEDFFNLKSTSSSPPPSPTRFHIGAYPARLPFGLSIPRTPSSDPSNFELRELKVDIEEPRLTPFDIPILLEQIISYLDESNTIPSEPAPVRRKPLSYQHAVLIYYPDVERAKEAWAAACRPTNDQTNSEQHHSGVYACLLVNREWNDAAKRVLRQKAFFTKYESWKTFATRKGGLTDHIYGH